MPPKRKSAPEASETPAQEEVQHVASAISLLSPPIHASPAIFLPLSAFLSSRALTLFLSFSLYFIVLCAFAECRRRRRRRARPTRWRNLGLPRCLLSRP